MMIIHNGIINDSLKNFPYYKFETKDYSVGKITDSEFLIPTIQNFINKGQDFDSALKNITEKYLFSSFFIIKKGSQKLYWGSNNQDLVYFRSHDNLWISSEYPIEFDGTCLINTYGWADMNGDLEIENLDLDNNFIDYSYGLDYWRNNSKAKEEKWSRKFESEDENEDKTKNELWRNVKYDL